MSSDPELDLDLLDELAALATPVAPSPEVRDRLLASVDALVQPGPLDRFAAALGAMLDVTIDKARMFLGWIDEPARWTATGLPGVDGIKLPAGPAWVGADCRLLRIAAGGRFPAHRHLGPEAALVLDGHAREPAGAEHLGPGDLIERPAGTEHELVIGDEPCVFAVRSQGMDLLR